jgi:hypothetical protein
MGSYKVAKTGVSVKSPQKGCNCNSENTDDYGNPYSGGGTSINRSGLLAWMDSFGNNNSDNNDNNSGYSGGGGGSSGSNSSSNTISAADAATIAPLAARLFNSSKQSSLTEAEWLILENMLQEIMKDDMGMAIYQGLLDLGIRVVFTKQGADYHYEPIIASIYVPQNITDVTASADFLHEMFHAYQHVKIMEYIKVKQQITNPTEVQAYFKELWNDASANLEAEAKIATIMYLKNNFNPNTVYNYLMNGAIDQVLGENVAKLLMDKKTDYWNSNKTQRYFEYFAIHIAVTYGRSGAYVYKKQPLSENIRHLLDFKPYFR